MTRRVRHAHIELYLETAEILPKFMSAGYPIELDALLGEYSFDRAFDEMRAPTGAS